MFLNKCQENSYLIQIAVNIKVLANLFIHEKCDEVFNQYRNSQVLFVLSKYEEKNGTEIDCRNKNRNQKMWHINDSIGFFLLINSLYIH